MNKITKGPSAGPAASALWGGRVEDPGDQGGSFTRRSARQGIRRSSTSGIWHEPFLHSMSFELRLLGQRFFAKCGVTTNTLSRASVDRPHFWLPIPDSSICRYLNERIRSGA